MKQDRFLVGILVFIGLLAVAAVALFLARGGKPSYGPEDTPQGVLSNYVVALQVHDYPRAYGYLADLGGRPSFADFEQVFVTNQQDPSTASLQFGDMHMLSHSDAWVDITIQNAGNGPFASRWSNTDHATLVYLHGVWKISYLPAPFWNYDWYQPTPVAIQPVTSTPAPLPQGGPYPPTPTP